MIDFSKIRKTEELTVFAIPLRMYGYFKAGLEKTGKTFKAYDAWDLDELKKSDRTHFDELKTKSRKTAPYYKKLIESEPKLKLDSLIWIVSRLNIDDMYNCLSMMAGPDTDPDFKRISDELRKERKENAVKQLNAMGIDCAEDEIDDDNNL